MAATVTFLNLAELNPASCDDPLRRVLSTTGLAWRRREAEGRMKSRAREDDGTTTVTRRRIYNSPHDYVRRSPVCLGRTTGFTGDRHCLRILDASGPGSGMRVNHLPD